MSNGYGDRMMNFKYETGALEKKKTFTKISPKSNSLRLFIWVKMVIESLALGFGLCALYVLCQVLPDKELPCTVFCYYVHYKNIFIIHSAKSRGKKF